jgi:hypothetical protein
VGVAPGGFYRPYYSFRPRVSIGFGIWAGFPIGYPYFYGAYGYSPYYYPYRYAYPYGYAYPYPYGYYPPYNYGYGYPPANYPGYPQSYGSPRDAINVQPGDRNVGGVSFEITPSTAEVYVDGSYVGTTGDFTPSSRPLDLTPGRHRIEIRAEDYRTMSFDADVVAGQVVPYRGALQR